MGTDHLLNYLLAIKVWWLLLNRYSAIEVCSVCAFDAVC